jgi:hypothetical protein
MNNDYGYPLVQGSVVTDINIEFFKEPIVHCFLKNPKLGYIRYSLLKKCKKGPRRNYTHGKPNLTAKFKFKETNGSPVSSFIYGWMNAISNNPIAEIGLMPGDNNG